MNFLVCHGESEEGDDQGNRRMDGRANVHVPLNRYWYKSQAGGVAGGLLTLTVMSGNSARSRRSLTPSSAQMGTSVTPRRSNGMREERPVSWVWDTRRRWILEFQFSRRPR
ncbi:unnamed protein product [Fusarium graminearum]|nr:unnamed protein product [Fusarium graminearum]